MIVESHAPSAILRESQGLLSSDGAGLSLLHRAGILAALEAVLSEIYVNCFRFARVDLQLGIPTRVLYHARISAHGTRPQRGATAQHERAVARPHPIQFQAVDSPRRR